MELFCLNGIYNDVFPASFFPLKPQYQIDTIQAASDQLIISCANTLVSTQKNPND